MKRHNPILNRETEVEIFDDSHEPWVLVRCKETNFYFIANPPAYERLEEEFAWEKTLEVEKERRRKEDVLVSAASTIAKKIKFLIDPKRNKTFSIAKQVLGPIVQSSCKILDVGCGNGKLMSNFCERFEELGVRVIPIGIEVSSQLVADSSRIFEDRGGFVIKNNAIDGMASVESQSIDMVVMNSFLEHECKPLELLRAVHHALKESGSVVLKVPNFDCWNRWIRGKRWAGYRFPDHVSYFTPQTLEMLAAQAGFELVRQNFSDRLPLSDNMYAVLKKAA